MIANPFIAEFAPHLANGAPAGLRVSPYALANGHYTEVGALLISGEGKEIDRCALAICDKELFGQWIEETQAWLAEQLKAQQG
jgi:hypothetical protein